MAASATVADLAAADLDVLVIGGGIVGAGAALDAVTRGLRVGLVEAGDWGGGRSGSTSTLVHGGLVDLPRIGVAGVAELRRERDLLLDRTAPHLVRRVPLLVPLTRGLPERLALGAALSLYDASAFSIRQPGVLPGHRQLPRRAVVRLAPALATTDISGAVQLFEAQVDDARLALAVVRTAVAYGVSAAARTAVRALLEEDGRIIGAEVAGPGGAVTVRARSVVVATGGEPSPLLSPAADRTAPSSETVHLVLPRSRLQSSTGLVLRDRGQALYVVPWGRHWIVGSTAAGSDPADVLGRLNDRLVRPAGAEDVVSTYASLAASGPGAAGRPAILTPQPGLVVVSGSGLSGYRIDAERAVDAVVSQIGGLRPSSTTRRISLQGAEGFEARWNQRHLLARRAGLPVLRIEHLLRRYGSEVEVLLEAIRREPQLAQPVPGAGSYLRAEVWFAVAHEDATQLDDVLVRRTRIAMETVDGGAAAAEDVARLMATVLGWDAQEISSQVDGHLSAVANR
jgi:glycerol-3-phosphate dehydrogenase